MKCEVCAMKGLTEELKKSEERYYQYTIIDIYKIKSNMVCERFYCNKILVIFERDVLYEEKVAFNYDYY